MGISKRLDEGLFLGSYNSLCKQYSRESLAKEGIQTFFHVWETQKYNPEFIPLDHKNLIVKHLACCFLYLQNHKSTSLLELSLLCNIKEARLKQIISKYGKLVGIKRKKEIVVLEN